MTRSSAVAAAAPGGGEAAASGRVRRSSRGAASRDAATPASAEEGYVRVGSGGVAALLGREGKARKSPPAVPATPVGGAGETAASTMAIDPAPRAAEPDASASASGDEDDGLTAYERERLANIARNAERMAALNLPTLAREVAPPPAAAPERQRGLSTRRRKAETEAPPPRKSLRGQGLAPDGTLAAGIADEKPDGSVVLVSGGTVLFAAPPRASRPEGDLPFASLHGTPDSDAAFVTMLAAAQAPPAGALKARTTALVRGVLSEERVAKLCPKGVTHIGFQHRADALVIAAGDKEGSVGLWRVDGADAADADGEDERSFRAFKPHAQYVSGLMWTREGASRLLTCSYDGSIRVLDPEAALWRELHVTADEEEFSAFDASADGNACFVADNRGALRVLDARARGAGRPVALHEKRINTVHLESGGASLATACGDSRVCIWDVRALGGPKARPVVTLAHGKSCQSAFFAPDGSKRLLVTSYDDTLSVWADPTAGAATKLSSIKHDNQTGRWVIPFRAVWSPAADAVVVGSMRRETELIDVAGRYLARLSDAAAMTAIPSRHACHAFTPAIAAATASGRVHVWQPKA